MAILENPWGPLKGVAISKDMPKRTMRCVVRCKVVRQRGLRSTTREIIDLFLKLMNSLNSGGISLLGLGGQLVQRQPQQLCFFQHRTESLHANFDLHPGAHYKSVRFIENAPQTRHDMASQGVPAEEQGDEEIRHGHSKKHGEQPIIITFSASSFSGCSGLRRHDHGNAFSHTIAAER